MKIMDKKGVLGLDTVKAVMLGFLILAALGIAIMLALSSLTTTVESIDKTTRGVINETTTEGVSDSNLTSLFYAPSEAYRGAVCTNRVYTNSSTGDLVIINSTNLANVTNSGCSFTGGADGELFGNDTWNVSYSVTYSNPSANDISKNISSALTDDFFNQTGTIFAILIVVVIILSIAIIIAVVIRFGEGAGVSTGGGGGGGGFGSNTLSGS